MKIKELNLISFSKFKNKNVKLKDGINIIYGENEAGKTSIHNFIFGMFYGFLRPYVTRAYYRDEHEKYDPWEDSDYRGNLLFEDKGQDYRLERIFTKGEEETKVYLDSTGEDITDSLDMGNTGRILQPGNHFFGFNDVMYSNTISIGQLASRTEENLVKEIKDRLANMTTSLHEEISVKNAINYIEEEERKIGSKRARTSPYGRALRDVKKLEANRKDLAEKKATFEDALDKNIDLEKEISKIKKELDNLLFKYRNIIYSQKDKRYNEANKLLVEIKELEEKTPNLEKYKTLSMQEYSKLSKALGQREHYNNKMLEVKENIAEVNSNMDEFKAEKLPEKIANEELAEDFKRYEELEERYKSIEVDKRAENIKFLKIDLTNNEEKSSFYKILLIAAIVISGSSLIASLLLRNFLYLLLNFISLPIMAYSISNIRRLDSLIERIEQYIAETFIKKEEAQEELELLNREIKSILKKYGVDNKYDLRSEYELGQIAILRSEDHKKDLEKLEDQAKKLSEELLLTGRDQYNNEQVISSILDKGICKDIKEYEAGLDKKADYEEAVSRLATKKELLAGLLKDSSLEELKEDLKGYKPSKLENNFKSRDVKKIKEKIDLLESKLAKLNIDKSRLEERIEAFNNYSDEMRSVEEDIFRNKNQIEAWEKKLEALNLAKTTIEDLAKKIHKEFAPMINDRVGKIIEKVTNGKYTKVRIDDELDINIVDNETKELIDVDNLSGGTIDQLYFALRYGILTSSEKENLPLILDDCFIQYDDSRLENILKVLNEESVDRQIILFTCQKREVDILEKNKWKYNLIEI